MSNKVRDTLGKFAPKSEVSRKVRSVNLSDDAWQWLATIAEKAGMSRNDYLETLAAENGNPFMEAVIPQTPPFMETVGADLEIDTAKMAYHPNSEVLPFIETVRTENQRLHIELGNSEAKIQILNQELAEARSQLETERADREKIGAEISELKKNFAPTVEPSKKLTPDAAIILSQLRARRKKSKADLADLELILEILQS
jgi:predicted outer membrane protein